MSQEQDETKEMLEDSDEEKHSPQLQELYELSKAIENSSKRMSRIAKRQMPTLQLYRKRAQSVFLEYTTTIDMLQDYIKNNKINDYQKVKLTGINLSISTSDNIHKIAKDCIHALKNYNKGLSEAKDLRTDTEELNEDHKNKLSLITRQLGLAWNKAVQNQNLEAEPENGCCVIL